jgi:imidazolonepropionase-like amidohydrolase
MKNRSVYNLSLTIFVCMVFVALTGFTFADNRAELNRNDSADSPGNQDGKIIFHKVNVLTMEDDVIHSNYSVVVDGDEIVWVGPSDQVDLSNFSTVIEGDYYLMPGLAEMHAHIPPLSQGEHYAYDVLKMYLSQGITTIRGMLGEPLHLQLRAQVESGEVIGPRIFTSGPSFSGGSVRDPELARQAVRDQFEAGYDLLKFHPGLTLEVFEAVTDEARKLGMEFSGHISYDIGLERTLESGKKTIDHLDRYMEFLAPKAANRPDPSIIYFGYDLTYEIELSRIDLAAKMTADAGVWVVPTNTLMENVFNPALSIDDMLNYPGMDLMPRNVVAGWTNYLNIIRNQHDYDEHKASQFLHIRALLTDALNKHNAGILLGADAPQIFNPPGYSAHREMELLVRYGLSSIEAIKTGTVNVGLYLDETDKTGKIAPGFRAEMILLHSNPLESIPFNSAIEGVMMRGVYYDRETLGGYLDEIRKRVQPEN